MVWNNYRLHLDGVDSDAQLLPVRAYPHMLDFVVAGTLTVDNIR
jgi:hypothetical protein